MTFNPQPKKGLPPKKPKKPLRRKKPIRKFIPFSKQIEKREKKTKNATHRSKLIKILDHVFSKFIRKRGADERGFNKCFTCPPSVPAVYWKELQCGHFISRNNLATRWDEDNCRPQCANCNMYNHGMRDEFARRLGQELCMSLDLRAHKTAKPDSSDLMEMIKKYETTLK